MTANELADWIENGASFGDYETAKQAVAMLRQQQAEIESLKKELALQKLSDIGQAIEEDRESAIYATGYWNGIAKVKPRELTDEEIYELADKHLVAKLGSCGEATGDVDGEIDFARAILKKASEK